MVARLKSTCMSLLFAAMAASAACAAPTVTEEPRFTPEQIRENLTALMDAVKAARPAGTKGTYVRSVTLTSTMGPGVPVNASLAQGIVA